MRISKLIKSLFLFLFFMGFQSNIAQSDVFDIEKISAELKPNIKDKSISGKVEFSFKVLKDTDSIFLDAKNMKAKLLDSKTSASLSLTNDKIWFVDNYKPNQLYSILFEYSAKPKQALYFVGFNDDSKDNDQIFTQGQGKYTSHYLPSIDDMNDKIEFDLSIIAPNYYGVIANGELVEQWNEKNGLSRWAYDMKSSMSSYLVAFSVGNYLRDIEISNSGIELHKYTLKQDSTYLEPTYRHTKTIFDFLETKIGVNYPWRNYKQVPVRDFLYAGMENTSMTVFSDAFVVDSIGYVDRNYVNVNAHELAHQWFGNLVTEKDSKDHWLHEGFATYYALLAEREIFGDDYFYHKLYEYAEALKAESDKGKGEQLLKPNASSLTYYQKGCWALFVLNSIVGPEVFDNAVKNFLNKYAFKNVTTELFMDEVKALTSVDLKIFEKDWFKQSAFKADQALSALESSLFMPRYLELIALRSTSIESKHDVLEEVFEFPVNTYMAQEVVLQLTQEPMSQLVIDLLKKAFKTNDIAVRQVLSQRLTQIPPELKAHYKSLLDDQSYQTQENALYNLWANYPDERQDILESCKNKEGFNDKNIKLLWLALNLVTPEYQSEHTSKIYSDLEGYTSSNFRFQIRENAFGYLYQINAFSDQALLNLMDGCFHHTWRFKDFCRQLLKTLLKDSKYKDRLLVLKESLTEKQNTYLNKIL